MSEWTALRHPILAYVLLAAYLIAARAVLQNVTVDDQNGDTVTDAQLSYSGPPNSGWEQGATCGTCSAHLNKTLMFDGTWHDATFHPGDSGPKVIEVNFTGSAVYAFFALANNISGLASLSNLSFSLDGSDMEIFTHVPSASPGYEYNVPAFTRTGLLNSNHNLVIQTTGSNESLVLFDYLVYSTDNDTIVETTSISPAISSGSASASVLPSPSASVKGSIDAGLIVGVVIAGVAVLAAALAAFFFISRHNRQRDQNTHGDKHSLARLDGAHATNSKEVIAFSASDPQVHQQFEPLLVSSPFIIPSELHKRPLQTKYSPPLKAGRHRQLPAVRASERPVQRQEARESPLDGIGQSSDASVVNTESNRLRGRVEFLLEEVERLRTQRLLSEARVDCGEMNREAPPDYSTQGRRSPASE